MKEKLIILFVSCIVVVGCASQGFLKSRNQMETRKLTSLDSTQIIDYFTSQLETDQIAAVDSTYYGQIYEIDSLATEKAKIWKLWKKANADRLLTLPEGSPEGTAFLWEIPQAQRMQVELLSKGSKPSAGYPFLINLHGGGRYPKVSGPWEAGINSREWEAAKSLGRQYRDAPSLYFIPRMADDRAGRWYLQPQQVAWLRAWQLAVLSGQADPDKTYIAGISEGGYGSFRMGTFYADYFAGIGPMAGPENVKDAPIENLRNTAIRIEVGEFDRSFDRNKIGRSWIGLLDSATAANPGQFDHVVVVQEGMGHGINYYDVTPWLVQKTRHVYPDTLSFMYYDIDKAYRKGFGYVRLDGLTKEPGARKSFKIIKHGNSYAITTADVSGNVSGKIALYLAGIDYENPVKVSLNGHEVFSGKVEPNLGVMVESIAVFGDPKRIFDSKVELTL